MSNHLKEVAEVAHIQRYIRLKAVKVCEHCRKEIAFLLDLKLTRMNEPTETIIHTYSRTEAMEYLLEFQKQVEERVSDERFRVYVNAIQTSGLPEHKPKPERVAQIAAEHNFYREAGMSMEAMRPQAKKKSA